MCLNSDFCSLHIQIFPEFIICRKLWFIGDEEFLRSEHFNLLHGFKMKFLKEAKLIYDQILLTSNLNEGFKFKLSPTDYNPTNPQNIYEKKFQKYDILTSCLLFLRYIFWSFIKYIQSTCIEWSPTTKRPQKQNLWKNWFLDVWVRIECVHSFGKTRQKY